MYDLKVIRLYRANSSRPSGSRKVNVPASRRRMMTSRSCFLSDRSFSISTLLPRQGKTSTTDDTDNTDKKRRPSQEEKELVRLLLFLLLSVLSVSSVVALLSCRGNKRRAGEE